MLSDTSPTRSTRYLLPHLNAPYGAPCFLTRPRREGLQLPDPDVLMHLMALRAFRL